MPVKILTCAGLPDKPCTALVRNHPHTKIRCGKCSPIFIKLAAKKYAKNRRQQIKDGTFEAKRPQFKKFRFREDLAAGPADRYSVKTRAECVDFLIKSVL